MNHQSSNTSNPPPLVSVILPVYNGETYLREALESLTAQSHSNVEIIVVDDGSTDATSDILDECQKQDTRIVVVRTENRGLVPALNSAISQASGIYIARMDADDICEPHRIAGQADHLDRHPACVAVGSNVLRIDDNGDALAKQPPDRTGTQLPDRSQGFTRFPPAPPTLVHPSAMIRASALQQVGGYRPMFKKGAEDRDLWWRLSELGKIECLPERLLRYRVHQSNRSHVLREGALADALVGDLSAICRFHDLQHDSILSDYEKRRDLPSTIERYSELLGNRYPAWALYAYRILRRRARTLTGATGMARFRATALRRALTNLSARPSWYVWSTIAR